MSKNTGAKRSKNTQQYDSSSASAVWFVVMASVILAGIAVIGTMN